MNSTIKKTVKRREIVEHHLPDELHPALKRIYASRGLTQTHELELSLKNLLPVGEFTSAINATPWLAEHLAKQSRLMIIGDYDVDGATSTVIALEVLRACGWKNISYLVPDRFVYGYGLSEGIVEEALGIGVDVIMTVDSGISSQAGVAAAREAGVDVIITDHHLPPDELPNANQIVNPSLNSESFSEKTLCGAGVVFYLMSAFIKHLDDNGWFMEKNISKPKITEWLDLLALATIADVVPMTYNNRILVSQGLARMRAGRTRPGIKALFQVAKKDLSLASSQDMGFAVAPRLNAAGRLDDMTIGIECLLSRDTSDAYNFAEMLDEINRERRLIQNKDKEQAALALESSSIPKSKASICLFSEEWHQGVVGLVASGLKEQHHKPAIIFAKVDDDTLKGSARSIDGLHIKHLLDGIAAEYPEVLNKYGGHAMAAGMTLQASDFELFAQIFEQEVQTLLTVEQREPVIWSDGELQANELSMQFAQNLETAGPWGNCFPQPLFDGIFGFIGQSVVGQKHLRLTLEHKRSGQELSCIAFFQESLQVNKGDELAVTYELNINRFRGTESMQLLIRQIEIVEK